ncbi:hypothetical protein MC885_010751 [Smutsia gigantea]|nr:hypothetical protein MC885_010751 [Smutsia gigantea]
MGTSLGSRRPWPSWNDEFLGVSPGANSRTCPLASPAACAPAGGAPGLALPISARRLSRLPTRGPGEPPHCRPHLVRSARPRPSPPAGQPRSGARSPPQSRQFPFRAGWTVAPPCPSRRHGALSSRTTGSPGTPALAPQLLPRLQTQRPRRCAGSLGRQKPAPGWGSGGHGSA